MVPINVAKNADDREIALIKANGSFRIRFGSMRSVGIACTGRYIRNALVKA
jgi:hypothetical protein